MTVARLPAFVTRAMLASQYGILWHVPSRYNANWKYCPQSELHVIIVQPERFIAYTCSQTFVAYNRNEKMFDGRRHRLIYFSPSNFFSVHADPSDSRDTKPHCRARRKLEMSKALGKIAVLSMLGFIPASAKDTESPNQPILKPECDASIPVSIRYSSASERLYLESADGIIRGGCVTLAQIWEHQRGKAPLYAVDPESGDIRDSVTGTWLLTEELFVEDGITLKVR